MEGKEPLRMLIFTVVFRSSVGCRAASSELPCAGPQSLEDTTEAAAAGWSFSQLDLSSPRVPPTSDPLRRTSYIEEQAACNELLQWYRLLSKRTTQQAMEEYESCRQNRARRVSEDDRMNTTTAPSVRMDGQSASLFTPGRTPAEGEVSTVSSLWAYLPPSAVGYGVLRRCEAPLSTSERDGNPQHQPSGSPTEVAHPEQLLLCVDVSGMYVRDASPASSCGSQQRGPATDNRMPTVKKVSGASLSRATAKRQMQKLGVTAQPQSKAARRNSETHSGGNFVPRDIREIGSVLGDEGEQRSLWRLAEQRAAKVIQTCPFKDRSNCSAHPARIAELWVVPLLWPDNDGLPHRTGAQGAVRSGVAFPSLVRHPGPRPTIVPPADAYTTEASGEGVRLAEFPPDYHRHLSEKRLAQWFPLAETCATSANSDLVCRKRRRADDAREAELAGGETSSETLQCGFHMREDAVSSITALPVNPNTPIRVLKGSFLSNSCFFSRWCCVLDFDVTNDRTTCSGSREGTTSKRSCHTEFHHILWDTLQRSVQSEKSAMISALKHEALNGWRVEEGHQRDIPSYRNVNRSVCIAGEPKAVVDDQLFAEKKRACDECDPQRGEHVWTMEEMWDLWLRLGWVPPVAEGLHLHVLFPCSGDDGQQREISSSHGTVHAVRPSSFIAWMARAVQQMDVAYIEQKRSRIRCNPGSSAEEHCEDAEFDNGGRVARPESRVADTANEAMEALPLLSVTHLETRVLWKRLLTFWDVLKSSAEFAAVLLPSSPIPVQEPCGDDSRPALSAVLHCLGEVAAPSTGALSAAATALAEDIAASTTPSQLPSGDGALETETSCMITFDRDWLHGVLESPEFLFYPCIGAKDARGMEKGGIEGSYDDTQTTDDGARVFTALLAQYQSLNEMRPCSTVGDHAVKVPNVPKIMEQPSLHVSEEAESCELADVAELRWSFVALKTTQCEADNVRTRSERFVVSQHLREATGSRRSLFLEQVCEEAAQVARGETVEERAATFSAGHHRLLECNSLAAHLYESLILFLVSHGIVDMGPNEGEQNAGVEEIESKFIDTARPTGTPSKRRHFAPSKNPFEKDKGFSSTKNPTLYVTDLSDRVRDAEHSSELTSCDEMEVMHVLSSTIARVVQQNKRTVQRVLRLIQSDGAMTLTDTRGASPRLGAGDVGRREADDTGSRDAQARDVWRCLAAPEPNYWRDMTKDEAALPTNPASATPLMRAAALRLLRSFWTSVAMTVRQHLGRCRDTSPSSPVCEADAEDDISGKSEEESRQEGRQSGAAWWPSTENGDAEEIEDGAAGIGVGPPSSDSPSPKPHSYRWTEKFGAVSPALLDATGDASAFSLTGAPPSPLLSATILPQHAAGSTLESPSATLQRLLLRLDGPQAMALYMQRVACNSVTTGRSSALTPQHGSAPSIPTTCSKSHKTASSTCSPSFCGGLRAETSALRHVRKSDPWLRHTVFLLSYGLAAPAECPSKKRGAPASPYDNPSQKPTGHGYEGLPSPELAAFRLWRGGKLALDVWIGTALETYVRRWKAQLQLTVKERDCTASGFSW